MKIDLGEKCPQCGSTMAWMPLDCLHPFHKRVKVSAEFEVLKSFDAREWAATFMATLRENPDIIIDQELMDVWFANALMRGYDERHWETPEYKRSIRRALHPWWSWKHWVTSAALLSLLLLTMGCAIRRPVHALYCEQMSKDGKHCLVWAPHKDLGCVHNEYGDCSAETK